MTENGRQVIIVGGGIAGLTLAIALARHGIGSCVLERRQEFSEIGAGLQLGPNATRVLDRLGILDRVLPHASHPRELDVLRADGARIAQLPLDRHERSKASDTRPPSPYLTIHRSDLITALVESATSHTGIQLETTAEVVDANLDGALGSVTLADGSVRTGSAVIFADGIWSFGRRLINPSTQPVFTNRTAARALIDHADCPACFRGDTVSIWLGGGAHLVHYPVRGGKQVNLVAIVEDDWAETSWSGPVDCENLFRHFNDWSPVVQNLMRCVPDWRKWALYECPAPACWSRGCGVLIGDAAHPILPFLAQGAAMAIEDAYVLSECMAAGLKNGQGEFAAIGARFHQHRGRRTERVRGASTANGRIYHLRGPARLARDAALGALPASILMARYDWLYGHDVTQEI